MDNPQAPNNQNNSGISGFGSIPVNNSPAATPPATPSPVQGFPETKPVVSSESVPTTNQAPAQSPPVPPTMPAQPMAPPASVPSNPFSSPDPTPVANLANQTLVGGVEENQEKHKKFSFSSVTAGPQTAPTMQTPPPASTNAYNEITASGSRNKFAMIAIIAGIVLLVLAGGGYYYLTMMKPAEVTEPEPIVEQPLEQPVVEVNPIDIDPYIMEMTQREATSTPEPRSLNEQVTIIDVTNIDSELQTSTGETQTVPTGAEEPSNPAIETEPVPMP